MRWCVSPASDAPMHRLKKTRAHIVLPENPTVNVTPSFAVNESIFIISEHVVSVLAVAAVIDSPYS